MPLSFKYIKQKNDFDQVSRRACILTAITSKFEKNMPLKKKPFSPTSHLKLTAVTIFPVEF